MKRVFIAFVAAAAGVALGRWFDGIPGTAVAQDGRGDEGGDCATMNGDVNADGVLDVSDAIVILLKLFRDSSQPISPFCPQPLAEVDCDGDDETVDRGIVFAAALNGASAPDLYTVQVDGDADGSTATVLTDSGCSMPRWSPDGRRIAFLKGDGIYVMRSDGSDQRRVIEVSGARGLDW
jgi:hypothetical protein